MIYYGTKATEVLPSTPLSLNKWKRRTAEKLNSGNILFKKGRVSKIFWWTIKHYFSCILSFTCSWMTQEKYRSKNLILLHSRFPPFHSQSPHNFMASFLSFFLLSFVLWQSIHFEVKYFPFLSRGLMLTTHLHLPGIKNFPINLICPWQYRRKRRRFQGRPWALTCRKKLLYHHLLC